MQYLIVFLEGIITFVSPCLLPMLPLYVSYFAGGDIQEDQKRKTLFNALGFVAGFTLVFVSLGAFAGSLGQWILQYGSLFNLVAGIIVIGFGLMYLGVFKLPALSFMKNSRLDARNLTPGKSVLFGIVFSISWTPCVGAFLGSALVLASQQGSAFQGILMLFLFSLGLGIPFVLSALLIDNLKGTFQFLKKHSNKINYVAGGLLVLMGILLMTGRLI